MTNVVNLAAYRERKQREAADRRRRGPSIKAFYLDEYHARRARRRLDLWADTWIVWLEERRHLLTHAEFRMFEHLRAQQAAGRIGLCERQASTLMRIARRVGHFDLGPKPRRRKWVEIMPHDAEACGILAPQVRR